MRMLFIVDATEIQTSSLISLVLGTLSEVEVPNCTFPCCWHGTINETFSMYLLSRNMHLLIHKK